MSYVPNTDADRSRMLESIGIKNVSELLGQVPESAMLQDKLALPDPLNEMELLRHMTDLACENTDLDACASFLGAGIYDHYIPATVPAIIGRSEFYTAYTPYQPELSQGNLQSMYEFQSLVCQLTAMDVANSSMYDAATAMAEAALMSSSITGKSEWVVSSSVHPLYRNIIHTYAWAGGFRVVETDLSGIISDVDSIARNVGENTACVIIQSPNFFGAIEPLAEIEPLAHRRGAMYIIAFDPISLGLLKPPGEFNADICIGEGQPLGIPTGFAGPLLGLFACKREYVRQMPGRIVGATTDTRGRRAYTLTLQTREQHIKRERATSNICTNEALYALAATVYLTTLGKHGLQQLANLCLQRAHYAQEAIAAVKGYDLPCKSRFFKEFIVKCPEPVAEINSRLLERNIIGGLDLGRFYPNLVDHMLVCVTERRTRAEIDSFVEGLTK
jgi:glycine dehydrogenase subunit 1